MTLNEHAGARSDDTQPARNESGGFNKNDTTTLSLEQLKAVASGALVPGSDLIQVAEDTGSRTTVRDRLIKIASSHEMWTDGEGNAYATIRESEREQHLKIRSAKYKRILMATLYSQTLSGCGSQAVEEALSTLEAKAQSSGIVEEPGLRVAKRDGNIYVDLADENSKVIEITQDGWQLCPRPPVKFVQRKNMLALPLPIAGNRDAWLAFVSLFGVIGDAAILLLAWLVCAWRGAENYPVLSVLAQQGSGKSTLMRALKRLIDPGKAELLNQPREERDLFISANNSHALFYDNISSLPSWLSDGYCKLSTGASFSTRMLHSNDEETLFSATRPVAFNGISDCASRPDLQSRMISIELTEPVKRKTEEEIWTKFEELRPKLLGFLLTVMSKALRNLPDVTRKNSEDLPRMADAYLWMLACIEASGYSQDVFKRAYTENQKNGALIALESSTLADVVRRGVESGELLFCDDNIRTTPASMLNHIKNIALDDEKRALPKCAKTLVDALTRLAPPLRSVGICFEKGKSNGSRYIRFIKEEKQDAAASLATLKAEKHYAQSDLRVPHSGTQGATGSHQGSQRVLASEGHSTRIKGGLALPFEATGSLGSQETSISPNEIPW